MPDYVTEAKVEAMIGDLFEGGDIDTTTTPTTAQVAVIMDDVEAELHSWLEQEGYSTPIVEGTNANAFAYITAVAVHGVCSVILRMNPAESYTAPGEEDAAQGRAQFHERKVLQFKKMVGEHKFPAARDTGLAEHVYTGSQENKSTGATKLPIFTRSGTDFPGSRTLEETAS